MFNPVSDRFGCNGLSDPSATVSLLGFISFSPPKLPGSDLRFAGSRGSSWHKWPMFRLMHRVHGRSFGKFVSRMAI